MKRTILVSIALLTVAACDTSILMKGSADDGEVLTGTATATGAWDVSGPLQLISNRGATCIGRFVYEGIAGPNGKATFTCNDGRTGEFNMSGLNNGNGYGTLGGKPIRLQWGRGALPQ